MMQRHPEPELMTNAAQVQAYALADFSEAHDGFVDFFKTCFPRYYPRRVLDMGCGAADVSLRFARAFPVSSLLGVDGAECMLAHGRAAVAGAGLSARVDLAHVHLPHGQVPERGFDTLISNSLLHHLHDPQVLWATLKDYGQSNAAVLIMDLRRPGSHELAQQQVQTYAGSEAEILKQDFLHSLLAAYTVDEVKQQLVQAGLAHLQVQALGDRHLAVHGFLQTPI